ncbi:hypothetical protein Lsan_3257 [Legionella santicrucis]|uniref:Uncharacterized protein n=1 Tax=Legionella santicrucis TaxID=45074 RepID=A0A0W0YFH0_9GAMM|nr:hypothetical protein Lsan_3257 [Legionella santicrucis]
MQCFHIHDHRFTYQNMIIPYHGIHSFHYLYLYKITILSQAISKKIQSFRVS